jgi:hypothetical protein
MAQRWAMDTPLCPGGEVRGKVSPLLQCCTLPAHEEATLRCVSCCDGHRLCRRCRCHWDCHCRLHCHSDCHHCQSLLLPLLQAFVVAVAVGHCCCCHHCNRNWPLPLPLHWPLLLRLLSAITVTIAVAVAIGHCRCRCRHHCHCHCHSNNLSK